MKPPHTKEILDAIVRVEQMRDETERSQIGWPVANHLAEVIREEKAKKTLRSEPYPDYQECEDEAWGKVNAMTLETLREEFEKIADEYWETAKSEAHEAYDTEEGAISAYDRVLRVLRGEES